MLRSLRSSGSNAFVWVIIILLVIGLAGIGINQGGGSGGNASVAEVGDEPVLADAYARALNDETRRLSQQFGTSVSLEQLSQFGLDQQILSQLLNNAALDHTATTTGLSVGDETVNENLLANQAFSDAAGGFSKTAYEFALENAGLEAGEYDEIVRKEATRRIFRALIAGGTRTPDHGAKAMVEYLSEARTLDWLRLAPEHLETPVAAPAEDVLTRHYEENKQAFELPETRTVTYAAATETSLSGSVEIEQSAIEELYADRAEIYAQPARRLVDRIIFSTDEDSIAALGAIEDGSKNFDEIAQDRGLGPNDIDLGEVTKDELPDTIAALLFGSEALGVIGPIETDFGPALYRVNAALDATETPLSDVTDELRLELALEEASDLIATETDTIIDLIASGASLEELAADTILELNTVVLPAADDLDLIASDGAFRDEAFASEIAEERDLIDLSDGIAILRVDAIAPAQVPPLADIREEVTAHWTKAETNRQLEVLAQSLIARVGTGEALADIGQELGLAITSEPGLNRSDIVAGAPPAFVEALFETNPGKGFYVTDADTAIMGVVREIIAPDLEEDETKATLATVHDSMTGATAQDLVTYFIGAVQDEAGVSVNSALIANIQSQLVATGQ